MGRTFYYLVVWTTLMSISLGNSCMGQAFKIYDTKQHKLIELQEVAASVADADVLFFGEAHDDSLCHALQDSLYGLLLDRYEHVSLSMEMFETDCQLVLDEYLAGFISEGMLVKDGRAWKNYEEHYKSMVEEAKANDQSVVAANAPRRYVRLVSRKGLNELENLPKAAQAFLPPMPIFTEDSAYYQRFLAIMSEAGHDAISDNFFHSQCLWDASMAYSVFKHWEKDKSRKIYHLNGRFHTDYKQGTVTQLQRLSKKINIQNITYFQVDDLENPNWAEYQGMADFLILSQKD